MVRPTKSESRLAVERPRIKRGFVFKSVFGHSEELTKRLIELSLGTEIAEIEIVQPERELDVLEDARAGRVDVFVVDAQGNRYDVEVQSNHKESEVMRTRHYQSLVDATQLATGTRATDLRDNVVIFVCDFDPLGDGLRLYDCRTVCLQTGRALDDGRRLVILNSKGSGDDIPDSLAAFLRLVAGEEVEGDPFVDRVNAIIDERIADPKWMEDYMTMEEELEAARYQAAMEGRLEGRQEGLEMGRQEGLEMGRQEGGHERAMEIALGLARGGVLSLDKIAEVTGVELDCLVSKLDGISSAE